MKKQHLLITTIQRIGLPLLLAGFLLGSTGCGSTLLKNSAPLDPVTTGCDLKKVITTGVHWFKDSGGAWMVVGNLQNNSTQTVSKINLGIETRTKTDAAADQGEDVAAYPLNLGPGQSAPFTSWIDRDIPKLDHFEVEIADCYQAEPAEQSQVDVRAGGVSVDNNRRAQVTAELFNSGTKTVIVNGLMAAVYDQAGTLITDQYADVTPRFLAPGESGPVRASMDLPEGAAAKVASYKLFMDVLVDPANPVTLDANRDVQLLSHYTDATGHFHQLGQITNSGTSGVMTSLQATMYSDASKSRVLDVSEMTTWVPVLPGETLPFELVDWGPVNSTKTQTGPIDLRIEPFLTWTTSASVKTLALSDGSVSYDNGNALFAGKAANSSDSGITSGLVTAVLREKSNEQIIAVGSAHLSITDSAAPGAVLSYSITVPLPAGTDPSGLITEVTAQGYQP